MAAATKYFICSLCVLLLAACGGSGGRADMSEFCEVLYSPRYAGGFEILGAEGRQSTILRVHNPWQGAEGIDTELFIARGGESAPAGFTGQVLHGAARRVVCMSSTHVAMMDAAGAIESVVGVSVADYITNEHIAARRDSTVDVGYEGNINYELLTAARPDIVLLYGLNGASGMEGKLRELRIPFAYIGDYLEQSPLGKAEWMVAVGEIAGCRERAESLYEPIPQRYAALRELAATASSKAPAVMLNTPYGDSWFMSPPNTYAARLIADAGGDYLYTGNSSTRSLPVDIEQASLMVSRADVWLNVGRFTSLEELRSALPRFAGARCVREGRVWNCDRRTNAAGGNDYWESGIVRPDVILRDLIKIFHPELLPDDTELVYYRRLE